MAVIELDVQQFFPMFQNDPPTHPDYASVSQYLGLAQSVNNFRKTGRGSNLFSMQQVVNARRTITNISLNQFLTMYQGSGKGEHPYLTDFFFMWQNARTVLYERVSQTLVFSEAISKFKGHGPVQTLLISQIVAVNVHRNIAVVQTYSPLSKGFGYTPNVNYIGKIIPALGGPNGTPEYVF